MEEIYEVIGVEHLKTILSGLTPEEIVKPAYDNWFPTQISPSTISTCLRAAGLIWKPVKLGAYQLNTIKCLSSQ